MNGRGGPIALVNIQATDFGLKNHMIQQVQNSCQFHGLPGDDANKHLDKFLTITQSMKQNGVTDDAFRLYLFPYSLTHHATAWFDRLPKNSIHTFQEMASKFLSKYFPPSMVTKLRNDISNFRQLPDESLFEAWERYKLSIDRCPNHNMLPVTQIDTFYNGLTLRHRDTINAAAGGTFMKRRPKDSTTSSSSEIAALAQQMIKMRKDMLHIYRSNQQVNYVTHSCETWGGPHSYYECQATGGYTQDVYATMGNFNSGAGPPVPPPTLSSSEEEVERDPEPTMDQLPPSPASRPFELPKRNPHQPPITYPSRLNKEKLQDKSDIQVHKFLQMFKILHFNISLADALALIPKYAKMLKDLLSDKEKLLGLANTSLTENYSAILLKKLPEKLRDPGKFLIPCDFPELEKCMALADLDGIDEGVCVQVGKFTFHADFVVVDYDVDPRVPLILRRPLLRTAHALVNVYGEELILRDSDEKLIFHGDSTSKHPHKHGNDTTSLSDSFLSLTPFDTSDSNLEEFANELALLNSFPLGNEDDNFDPEADLREIEYLLNRDPSTDSSLETDIDIIDPILERNILYHDPFDDIHSVKDKIKDSKMKILIDELESLESNVLLPQLLDCDSTLHEELPEIDTLPSFPSENEDKVFNLGILVHGSTHVVTNEVTQDMNLKEQTSSEALLILEDSNFLRLSSYRELLFHLELTVTETLLSFSSKNEDKVFNPGILISKGVHSFTLGLSHRTDETFKIVNVHPNILNESPMKIFPFFCFCPKDKGIRGESS
ncbi:reverse transcriptase domain-containing protein [Tanacetum coccineum]